MRIADGGVSCTKVLGSGGVPQAAVNVHVPVLQRRNQWMGAEANKDGLGLVLDSRSSSGNGR